MCPAAVSGSIPRSSTLNMAYDPHLNRSLVRLPPTLPVDFPPFNPSHPFYTIQTNSTPELVQKPNRGGNNRGHPLLRSLTTTRRKREPHAAAPITQEERSYVLVEQPGQASSVSPKPLSRSRSWSVRKTLEAMARPKTSDGPQVVPLELSRPFGKIVGHIGRSFSQHLRKDSVPTRPVPMSVSSTFPQENLVENSRSRRYGKIYATSPM
jgi:hypothetical protein